MTSIKLCGLSREEDIAAVNTFMPEYIGFVFWQKSKRYVDIETAKKLKGALSENIKAVGVFVDEDIDVVADLLVQGVIDMAQLHGKESESYIKSLRELTGKPIIKAFLVKGEEDIELANQSIADFILLDAGLGQGECFDWELLSKLNRPYFLAGGLLPENVPDVITNIRPYAVDVSSGIETDGHKDVSKMGRFVADVRLANARVLSGL